MRRWMMACVVCLALAVPALGHFVFVVPEGPGNAPAAGGLVIMSETLKADEAIDIALLRDARLLLRDEAGRETPLALRQAEHAFAAALPGAGNRVIHGVVDLGVTQRGESKPNVLIYYPKTILGDAFDAKMAVGAEAVAELVPVGKAGAVRFKLLARGKPQANAEITVLLPDGTQKAVTTDAEGLTEVFAQAGRFGAWARFWEATPGERAGKKYEEVRHYATLVIDAGAPAAGGTTTQNAVKPALTATPFGKIPEAASSFGAVVSDGWLYVYGGHIVATHSYSTAAVSGKFSRLNLAEGKTWETLAGGPPLQGMNLAAHAGKVYRIGGMQPHNKPGDPDDVRSTAECAVYDPARGVWAPLPALPEPRSSHDVVVLNDKLYVIGGWNLRGEEATQWLETMLVLDLKDAGAQWQSVKQPFKRRALIAAVQDGKIYSIGGFNEDSEVINAVDVFDSTGGQWTGGPAIPGGGRNGFGPAACTLEGRICLSVADGTLYRISASGKEWERAGAATPRIVHRLAPLGKQVLVIGGAGDGANFDLIEALVPQPRPAP